MLSHEGIWQAIDTVAERHQLSVSALARKAGLDPTTFNRSKRVASDGRPRWPSTESIAKILEATGETLGRFVGLAEPGKLFEIERPFRPVPLVGLARAGTGGYSFDEEASPPYDISVPPTERTEGAFALEITGDSMLPLYRRGDMVVASSTASVRPGDRVVVRTHEGEVMAKILARQTAEIVELASLNPDYPIRVIERSEIHTIARIIWASQ